MLPRRALPASFADNFLVLPSLERPFVLCVPCRLGP